MRHEAIQAVVGDIYDVLARHGIEDDTRATMAVLGFMQGVVATLAPDPEAAMSIATVLSRSIVDAKLPIPEL